MGTHAFKFLLLGTNESILLTIQRLIEQSSYGKACIAKDLTVCLNELENSPYDLRLVCSGITEEEKAKWHIGQLFPQVKIVTHYGGGSGLLHTEIREALGLG